MFSTLRPKAAANLDAVFNLYTSVRTSEVSDGLSNTMAFGEMLTGIGADDDLRGVFWYTLVGTARSSRSFPPTLPVPT